MFQTARLPLASLIELCRSLRHYLGAGLTLRDVFRQQARKGPPPVRALAESISTDLEKGEALEDVLKKHRAGLPPLFVALASVGEQSGNLPEVFGELEKYFLLQQKLLRQFRSQITWPLFQYFVAILVIAAIPLLLGMFNSSFDPLGFGVSGTTGALLILAIGYGGFALVVLAVLAVPRMLKQKAMVDRVLLHVPLVGPCLEALALTRLCLALRLILETGMSVIQAVKLSFRATGNEAFIERTDAVTAALRRGNDLSESLAASGMLPQDFQYILANAEEAGTIPEVLHHQAEHYNDVARERLTLLTTGAGWAVWFLVACMLIFLILRLASSYLAALNQFSHF